MTDTELRIKVAELCGYVFEHRHKGSRQWAEIIVILKDGKSAGSFFPGDRASDRGREMIDKAGVPDYPSDLNAMHEAEKALDREQGVKYRLRLMFNSDGPKAVFHTIEAALCHATARQRAEAFAATLL
jgi:hypothetical protein